VVNLHDEFDSARLYLARWAMGITEQSDRERQQNHQVVWAKRDALELVDSAIGEFEILDLESGSTKLDSDKRKLVSLEEWKGWFDLQTGKLAITANEAKERIFHSGVDRAWGCKEGNLVVAIGCLPLGSTKDERIALMNNKRDEYVRLKGKWWEDLDRRNNDEYWRDQKNRIGMYYRTIPQCYRTAKLIERLRYEIQRRMFTEPIVACQSLQVRISRIRTLILRSPKLAPTFTWRR